MTRLLFTAAVATMLGVSSPAWAQDDPPDETSTEEAADPAADSGDSEPSSDVEAEEGEEPEGDAEEAADEAPATTGDEVVGPGGRPLRTDYPGTEESLKARMNTNMIEGIGGDASEKEAAYGMRIRELETKVDDLKERVFQSKTRIVLLRETLLSGKLAGARAVIVHKTELGPAWKLGQAFYALDGTKLLNKTDEDGQLADERVFQVYDGSVTPGSHNLSVLVSYKGTNVGIFPYFKGYEGDIKSSCDFKAEEGKIAQVKVSVYPKGGVGQSIEQRPQVKCEVEYFENLREEGVQADSAEN